MFTGRHQVSGETEDVYSSDEDLYEDVSFFQQEEDPYLLYQNEMLYQNDKLYQNEPPIYQNITQSSKNPKAVFGELFHATGRQAEGAWTPSYQKGISTYPPDTETTLDEFLKNYEEYFGNAPLKEKENTERVKFLLQTVFPYLESTLDKTGITQDILDILVRLSCCKKCSLVTRHALFMIMDIISKTSYDSGEIFNNFIIKCESDLRDSIVGQALGETAVIDNEIADDQGLRVTVYTRVLIVLYANVMQGLIPLAGLDEIEKYGDLVKKLTGLQEQKVFGKKEWPRYAVCCIKEIQARLTTPQKRKNNSRQNFLTWLQDHNRSTEDDKIKRNESVKIFFSKIKASKETWLDFHIVVFYLGSQLTERPRNVDILRTLVQKYLEYHSNLSKQWSSEGEWQTGLVLGSVLEGIVNHNHDKDTRTTACMCLVDYFTSLKKRNSLEKLWAKESLQLCLYGPVENMRQFILSHLELTQEISRDHLLQRYKKELPKNSLRFIRMHNGKGYFSGTFRGENATIKILDSILGEEKPAPTRIHCQLVIEAYFLRRLNSKPHPNILKVFAYDTSAQPYHLITEQVAKGSLLQYLQDSRSQLKHMPSPSQLTKMMLGIMDAVIYLNEQHLVHLAITAANVLVSKDNVCKLTGFQFTREMTEELENGRYEYVSACDDISIRHAAPECFRWGQFSEKSVSWAIGVMLSEVHTYGVAPYNQFSNQQAEQIRDYVLSGGKLKMENCIHKEVRELIQKALEYDREKRPDLLGLKIEINRIYENFTREGNDCPAESYPSLTNVDLAQTKDAVNTSNALDYGEKENIIGYLASPTRSHDIPVIRLFNGVRQIRELVENIYQPHFKKLKNLKHKNIVAFKSLDPHGESYMALVTEDSGLGNLLQIVLKKQVGLDILVSFIAQIAQAMEYMHDNDIIHSDLRAENIMVFPKEVKVSRLGRSKSVGKLVDIRGQMPEDAVRWSPPEVIKDGIYSHSSDVYSFGLMCFELFTAFSAADGSTAEDVKPFPSIKDEQVLAYLECNNRPARPESMPIWLFIIVKQCLLHRPAERPPFILIVDALTSRKPFESCLLSHWIERHRFEADNIDINKTQPERSSHVIPKENRKSCEELHDLVALEVFQRHTYSYKAGNKKTNLPPKGDEEFYDYEVYYISDAAKCVKRTFEGDNVYEQIPRSNTGEPQHSRLPPTPPLHRPVQETGNPTSARANSECALYATGSIITSKFFPTLPVDNSRMSDVYYSTIDEENNENTSSPESWSSLPAAHIANKNSTSLSTRGNGSGFRASTVRVDQILEEDEGAVGRQPVQDSWYSSHDASINDNNGATESSYHSLTSVYGEQNDHCHTSPLDRPVPLPRHRLRKHES